ncbi:MAG: hypothetical protein Q4G48_10350, partial [Bacteroidia bacterium]|nr:hypothetical protein [Bacteroidia bacterium]
MYNRTERLFFELLQCAIWAKKPEPALFNQLSSQDWEKIIQLSIKQSVHGLVADVILALPETHLPAFEKRVYLLRVVDQVKQLNINLGKQI